MMKRIATAFLALLLLFAVGVLLAACGGTGEQVSLYDGDSFQKQVTVTAGESYDFGVPTKNGYTFLGWYSAKEGGTAYTNAQGKSDGQTWKSSNSDKVYARFKPNNYVLFFDYCEATGGDVTENMAVTYDTELGQFPVPTKEGLSFVGWFTDPEKGKQITDGTGKPVAGVERFTDSHFTLSNEGIMLYARWGAKQITYTFVSEGTAVKSVTYAAGTVLYELPGSTLDNTCFVAWCFDEDRRSELILPYTVSAASPESVTLYAKFEAGSSVLSYNSINFDREYEVSYTGTDAVRLVVPSSYFGKKVTGVGRISSTTVREILLPQTITTFSNGAFEGCTALERITIPSGVETLPQNLFKGCAALKSIIVPQKVTTIGKEAFSGCASITSLLIPKGVATIAAGAFRDMTSLEAFTVAEGNEKYRAVEGVLYAKIGTSAYLVQYPLAKAGSTYVLDADTVKVQAYAFSSSSITSIVLGGKITTIEEGAFANCKNLVNVTISSTAATFSIAAYAFADCTNLKAMKLELSKVVPTLADTALSGYADTFAVYVNKEKLNNYKNSNGWRAITSRIASIGNIFGDFAVEEMGDGYAIKQYFGTATDVVIPEVLNGRNIVKIGDNAFSYSTVERVVIPQYVTAIGDNAFRGCAALDTIVVRCAPPTLGSNAFDGIHADYTIGVDNTNEVLEAYKNAPGWSAFSNRIWSAMAVGIDE